MNGRETNTEEEGSRRKIEKKLQKNKEKKEVEGKQKYRKEGRRRKNTEKYRNYTGRKDVEGKTENKENA